MNAEAESEFIEEIIANPQDQSARLIFADWLEEQGDPRGEFIRIQCELSAPSDNLHRREELDNRQEQLRRVHEHEWIQPLHGRVSGWTFHCGFVESVEMTVEQFLKYEAEIRRRIPLRYLTLQGGRSRYAEIMKPEVFQKIESLRCESVQLTRRDTEAIASIPLLRLHTLNLSRCRMTDDVFAPIVALQTSRLRDMDLSLNHLRNQSTQGLVESSVFTNLERLILYGNEIRTTGARALAQTVGLQKLRFLDIGGNPIGDQGREAIARRFNSAAGL